MGRATITAPAVTRRIGAKGGATIPFDSLPFGAGGFGGVGFTYTDTGPHRRLTAPAATRKLEAPRA